MKTYENPSVEMIDFMAETVMTDEELELYGVEISGGAGPRPK